ncbi:NPCBM/NEW2 domain-containing protein [Streptomyces sp. NPDC005794]|uniref:NPCBM/NEW2 domain-containing protein n=1 Tax=Streptomyces sp. NPDC005794 TaxID=3364733 RepID=UPI00368A331F
MDSQRHPMRRSSNTKPFIRISRQFSAAPPATLTRFFRACDRTQLASTIDLPAGKYFERRQAFLSADTRCWSPLRSCTDWGAASEARGNQDKYRGSVGSNRSLAALVLATQALPVFDATLRRADAAGLTPDHHSVHFRASPQAPGCESGPEQGSEMQARRHCDSAGMSRQGMGRAERIDDVTAHTRRQKHKRISAICAGVLTSALLAAACGSGNNAPAQSTSPVSSMGTLSPSLTPTQTETPSDASSNESSESATSEQYLQDLEPLSSSNGVNAGSAQINGRNYARSVFLPIDKGSIPENDAEYNLGRHWRTLQSVIGLRDDAPTGCRVTFEVFADGKSINNTTLGLGESRNINLGVTNVLRIKIEVTYAATTDISAYCYAVWGDAHLNS